MTTDPSPDPAATAPASADPASALSVSHLDVTYQVRGQDRLALRDVSFSIERGESYGLVGESGSGKSTVALALVRYLPSNGRVSAGTISINGLDPLSMGRAALRDLRARTVSMVYQEPGRALNPSLRAGQQIAEVFQIAGESQGSAMQSAEEMLRKVQIADPGLVMQRYPHELSGGMAQRVVIAMALAISPSLLILDEPTTALDATVQIQILLLLRELQRELGMAVIFVTHDVGAAAEVSDRLSVMYAGRFVETGTARDVLRKRVHPYTEGLLAANLHGVEPGSRLLTIPGAPPNLAALPPGCSFAPRCAYTLPQCLATTPLPVICGDGHTACCLRAEERIKVAA